MPKVSENAASELVRRQAQLEDAKQELYREYPGVDELLAKIEYLEKSIEAEKANLKSALVSEEDFDIHECEGIKYSVSKVVKLAVKNIDLVPAEFKSTMEVADEKKAQSFYKLYGEPPTGFDDKSYVKLNIKEK